MNLKEAKEGNYFSVIDMHLPLETERRLEVLGLTEHSKIFVMSNKKKGAMIVRIRGSRFALGRKIAENILVEEV